MSLIKLLLLVCHKAELHLLLPILSLLIRIRLG
uniref:Uncharacterized protein n=1 Tax=CrAss-like virus sp. ctRQZ5 TaxID=2826824 RepID=A0A8S5LXE5_9CAUD|nr:MAG TPA: hypothetical protein [CrAss-like virus sp. ctRQZ5]